MSTFTATITENPTNWAHLTITVVDAFGPDDDDTIWTLTSAYSGLDTESPDCDRDQLKADVADALAPEWTIVSWADDLASATVKLAS